MSLFLRFACSLVILCASARLASGVILLETDNSLWNRTTPGDNSGWQFQGTFGGFLGTPIAPFHFITANHIGGVSTFVFHGETFNVVQTFADPAGSDLRIWQVDHAFRTYAPLYLNTGGGNSEIGRELRVFGRGTDRGGEITLDGTLRGWAWGAGNGHQRWGSNTVAAVVPYPGGALLQGSFDLPGNGGVANEAHLSGGDSGGAVFILEDGLWKLAAINLGVDDLYSAPMEGAGFVAAIFDARGFYTKDEDGNFVQIPNAGPPVPTSFYSTRIAARLAWIQSVTGVDSTTLPAENFDDWLRAYFLTPSQITDPAVIGPAADFDADGIPTLLEFAFNLDPTFAERATMAAGTGLRGLPLIRLEPIIAPLNELRLTVEFVRRTTGSGSGLTYVVQFANSLAPGNSWQTGGGTGTITPINARWERVKVTDSVVATGGEDQARFARVVVTQASP